MGSNYSHFNAHSRRVLEVMLQQECSVSRIAKHLRVHRSTVYREIKRNQRYPKPGQRNDRTQRYASYFAHRKYLKRRQRCSKINSNELLRALVHKKLKAGWSPWQIEWHLKHDPSNELEHKVTHETIYRYIYSHWERRNEFAPCLRRKRLSRVRQGSRKKRFPSCMLISTRPDEIEKRETFGHWECDLMMFQRGIKHNLITLVERMSRYTIAIKNNNKQSKTTAYAIISGLKQYKPFIKSITFDQGSEFLKFPLIQDCLNTAVYFCRPASPYQKGSIENRNGVIRTVYPRDCNIKKVSQKRLDTSVKMINERPMRCLNYFSPEHAFRRETKSY